jgi:parvulin-like peptidyl-prolyl isomerase
MPDWLRRLAQDRLIWFVVLGVALFGADRLMQMRAQNIIKINLPLVEKLVAQWEGQTERRPNARELDALIEGYIREEILVREAARLGLDNDDIIIRRRLAQKVEFLLADEADQELPDEAALRRFFDDNQSQYETPETLSWRHVFADSAAAAEEMKAALQRDEGDWQNIGKPFMLNRQYARQSELDLSRLMGTQFAAALFAEKTGAWRGSVQSAFGWHVVKIDTRHAAAKAQFDPMIEQVARDYQKAQRQAALAEAWGDLRARYQVELLPVEGAGE